VDITLKTMHVIKKIGIVMVFILIWMNTFSQTVFYQDVFYGGVTGGGFSTGLGAGSGTINLHIEPGSAIRKAFLICQRFQNPPPAYITVNSISYLLDASNELTSYMIVTHSQKSGVHVVDITSDINPNQNTYFITIPSQTGDPERAYNVVYLLILYENSTLPKSCVNVILNNQDLEDSNNKFYFTNNINPINPNFPVGFALNTDRIRNPTIFNDGSHVFFNSVLLGLIGGIDANSIATGGIQGHFYYQNNTLFGLDDDTPDNLMAGTDGLADVSSYISNNSTSYNFNLRWQDLMATSRYNIYNSFFVTYTTPCDTFSTSANSNIDTICEGESIQLNATGGVEYSWYSVFSTFNDSTLANPIASPTKTTTYIVTIKNDSGCVKTEHVKVWVNPAPEPDTIVVTPQRCGSANGSITVGNIPKGTAPFSYELTNLQTLNTINQTTTVFSNLQFGTYQLSIQDSNGCQWQSDTLVINEINDITANFSVYALPVVIPTPNPLGTAPLTVYTQNSSVNATSFEWTFSQQSSTGSSQDTIAQYTTFTPHHSFENGGTFEICLFAYNNIPVCGDTVCKTIVVAPAPDSLVLVVPNVFSPNADGSNDNFVLQVQSANLLEKIEVDIFNRWGMIVESRKLKVESSLPKTQPLLRTTDFYLWDGTTTTGTPVPEGTYFYVINYTKVTGENERLKGSISLLR
jgi:hypothetical protein